ncbi:MAG: response regulator transcription factor [Chloroflexi bacterium]|nr:response regulator transcription factor [Chloroflexota bacterium]
MTAIQVGLADDHPLILKVLRQELERALDLHILWDTDEALALPRLLQQAPPDVLILDLAFAGRAFDAASFVRDVRGRYPQLKVLIFTAYDDPTWVEELLTAGAHGYVVKSDDFSLRLVDAVRAVAQGRPFLSQAAILGLTHARLQHSLTARERAILRLASEGHDNQTIAASLGISHGTVRNHLSNIYAKLGVDSREAAVRAAEALRELPRADAHRRHELRTPLHTLLGLARLLRGRLERQGVLSREDADELIEQIIVESERLDGLIDELIR